MLMFFAKFWPLICATLLYVAQLSIFCLQRNWPMAITFAAYALANVGIIWSQS